MAQETVSGEVVDSTTDKKPGRFSQFRTNHPRITRALTTTGLLLLVGGGAYGLGKKNGANSADDSTSTDSSDLPTDYSSES